MRKLSEAHERRYGKIGQAYPKITFDKELRSDYSDLEFVGPGHPLFEGVVERVLREYGPALRQGAVFYNADATEPTVLWLLKCGVEDGRGQPVGERLFAVHLTAGRFRKSQPYALLDLKAPECLPALPDDLKAGATTEDRVIDWSLDEVIAPNTSARSRTAASGSWRSRRNTSASRSSSSSASRTRRSPSTTASCGRLRLDDDPNRLNIQGNRAKEEARRTELSQRLKDRLAEIEQERHLSEKPPEVLGVAVILPPPARSVASVEGMESDPEVEAIAIEEAKKYEVAQGRKPVSVEEENCGWDFTSLQGGEVARYIEVKGRAGVGGCRPDAQRVDQGPAVRQGLLALRRGQLQDEARTLPDPGPGLEADPEGGGQRRAVHGRSGGLAESGDEGSGSRMSTAITPQPLPPFDDDLIDKALDRESLSHLIARGSKKT